MAEDASRATAQAAFGAPAGPARRPSPAGYWVGAALILAGVLGAVAWFAVGMVRFSHSVDGLGRVSVPGSAVLALEEGRQSVYYEGPGGEDADVPPLRLRVAPAGGGAPLDVGPHSGSVSYSMSGHAGRSVAGFGVPRDGRYRVSVDGPEVGAQIAVGPGLGGRIVRAIVGGFAILLLGGIGGSGLIVLTSVRRARATAVGS
jgi:hypothetical protein